MTSRLPVHSTPNLHHCDDEFQPANDRLFYTDSVSCLSKTYSLKRINFESESDIHASRHSVCSSKSNRVQITTSFINLSTNNGSSTGKVHFSPVVSEVRSGTISGSTGVYSDKDYYSPSCVDAMVKKLFDCEEEEKEGHMDIKCVNVDANEENSVVLRPSHTMDSYQRSLDRDRDRGESKSPKHLSKVGEFFQRFSFKRLSGRSNHSKRKEDKKNGASKKQDNSVNVFVESERNVEETKIIPLHPSSKPPLPPSSRRRPNPVYPHYTEQVSSSMSAAAVQSTDHDGILETDLDSEITTKKAQSLLNLDDDRKPKNKHPTNTLTPHTDYRAKSMEFLLDKENQEAVKPPENELRKERVLSEHELRVQRSLQKLDVPEWYKNHPVPAQGFLLKRHSDAGVPPVAPNHHWPGLSSKTTSLSSLGSAYSTSALRNSPDRTSNSVAPPCPPLFSRWSTSKLNSAATSSSSSPCGSARSSFNHRTPYLGWRYSQERLNKPKTPNERLAASILQNSFSPNCTPNDNEVRTSIKEVTSAIVHYVSAREQGSADKLNASSRYLHDSSSPSRSISPKGSTGKVEKCWLESSFIGCRPIELPPSSPINNPPLPADYYLNLNNNISSKSAKGCANVNGELSTT
uniref:Uncharacterized protein n=2 Tax=Cacopsylla melanoneura TaxID=428564 RepID=A0A8D8TGL2_9HEMI